MARSFSEDLKWRIVFLHHDGHSRKKIVKLLYISKGIVDKVWQIYMKWETVEDPWRKPPGRHKTLNRNEMKVIYKYTMNIYKCKLLLIYFYFRYCKI